MVLWFHSDILESHPSLPNVMRAQMCGKGVTFEAQPTLKDLLLNNSICPMVSLSENCLELSLPFPAKCLPQIIHEGVTIVAQGQQRVRNCESPCDASL